MAWKRLLRWTGIGTGLLVVGILVLGLVLAAAIVYINPFACHGLGTGTVTTLGNTNQTVTSAAEARQLIATEAAKPANQTRLDRYFSNTSNLSNGPRVNVTGDFRRSIRRRAGGKIRDGARVYYFAAPNRGSGRWLAVTEHGHLLFVAEGAC